MARGSAATAAREAVAVAKGSCAACTRGVSAVEDVYRFALSYVRDCERHREQWLREDARAHARELKRSGGCPWAPDACVSGICVEDE